MPEGMIRQYGTKIALLHRLMDTVLIVAAFLVAQSFSDVDDNAYQKMVGVLAAITFYLVAESRGFYVSWRTCPIWQEASDVFVIWLQVVALLLVLTFITKTYTDFSRQAVVIWLIMTPGMILTVRLMVRGGLHLARRYGYNSRTVAIVGANEMGLRLAQRLDAMPWAGLVFSGFYDDRLSARLHVKIQSVGKLPELLDLARTGQIDCVYIALPMHAEKRIIMLVDTLADTTVSVYIVPDFFVFNLLHARWTSLDKIPMVSIHEDPFYGVDGWVKRWEDIVIGMLAITIFAVPMAVIALAIKLSSKGKVLFKQHRYGLNGKVLEVWKFRTMHVCDDGDHVPQATKTDTRVTTLGKFLRRTSLDELPQLINVLEGSMSLVGPRPHAVAHNEQYRALIYGYMLRHKVKPGITGWAQVNGWRGETDTVEKMKKRVEYDLEYIRNWSLWLDVEILWLTLWRGFAGKNAY